MLTRERVQHFLDGGWKIVEVSGTPGADGRPAAEYWVFLIDESGDTLKFPIDPDGWRLAVEVTQGR